MTERYWICETHGHTDSPVLGIECDGCGYSGPANADEGNRCPDCRQFARRSGEAFCDHCDEPLTRCDETNCAACNTFADEERRHAERAQLWADMTEPYQGKAAVKCPDCGKRVGLSWNWFERSDHDGVPIRRKTPTLQVDCRCGSGTVSGVDQASTPAEVAYAIQRGYFGDDQAI